MNQDHIPFEIMKDNMRDEELWAVCFIITVIIVASACLGGCAMVENTNREAIKAGLVQANNGSGFYWTKKE